MHFSVFYFLFWFEHQVGHFYWGNEIDLSRKQKETWDSDFPHCLKKISNNFMTLVSLVWNKILFYCYISTYLGSLKLFLINDTEFMVPLEAASFVLAIEIRNGGGLRQDSFHFVLSLNGWVQPPKQPRAQRKECNCVFLFSPSEMWCTIF